MTLDNLTLHYNIDEFKQDFYKKGLNNFYKGQILEDNFSLDDYIIEKDDCIIPIPSKLIFKMLTYFIFITQFLFNFFKF